VWTRLAIAFAIAFAISLAARRVRALSVGGTAAATAVGTLALLAGWKWGVLLLIYFVTSSSLSRLGANLKTSRTTSIIEKGGERDAIQVAANGVVFAIAAALAVLLPGQAVSWAALGAGALAASASDTWGTEIGTLVGGTPRSIIGFAQVPVGMSGGVTLAGFFASVAGAAFVALIAAVLGWSARIAIATFIGGVAGSTIDSLLGASLQTRRRCDRCACETERIVHDCGTPTRRSRGLAWLSNDAVNFVCGAVGGLLALMITG
jgi:uncharacterized protein (TIGR00297 family)